MELLFNNKCFLEIRIKEIRGRKVIKIIIADDHAIVRSGIAMMINSQPDMEVIAEAVDGDDVISKSIELKPDVVIMDLNMPPGKNGLIATKQLKEIAPEIHIVVLTMHDDSEYIFRVLQAGASGYILKSAEDMELINAIRTVCRGEAYLYPKATRVLIESYFSFMQSNNLNLKLANLTGSEEEILSLLAKGYNNNEIAEKTMLSSETIVQKRSKIMEKLALKTRPDLVKFALENGLLNF